MDIGGCRCWCVQDWVAKQAATWPDVPPEAGVGEEKATGQKGTEGADR